MVGNIGGEFSLVDWWLCESAAKLTSAEMFQAESCPWPQTAWVRVQPIAYIVAAVVTYSMFLVVGLHSVSKELRI